MGGFNLRSLYSGLEAALRRPQPEFMGPCPEGSAWRTETVRVERKTGVDEKGSYTAVEFTSLLNGVTLSLASNGSMKLFTPRAFSDLDTTPLVQAAYDSNGDGNLEYPYEVIDNSALMALAASQVQYNGMLHLATDYVQPPERFEARCEPDQ